MNFREQYEELTVQEVVDSIVVLLSKNGAHIDDSSFTWTLVGALFDHEILKPEEFESTYHSLVSIKRKA